MQRNILNNKEKEKHMEAYFYSYYDMNKLLNRELREKYNEEKLNLIIDLGIVVPLEKEKQLYFLKKDFFICKKILEENYNIEKEINCVFGYRSDLLFDVLKIGNGTFVKVSKDKRSGLPAFIRNIFFDFIPVYLKMKDNAIYNWGENSIISNNFYVKKYLDEVQERRNVIKKIQKSDFANTSTYMGIKRPIMEFIMEAIIPNCNENTAFFDLMCGSGIISNVFSKYGTTYASDAQLFCRLLAKVQGQGMNSEKAYKLLDKIYPDYLYNMKKLDIMFAENINKEANIFHMDMANPQSVAETYLEFINNVELYSSTQKISESINCIIEERKQNNKLEPYCLFTLYFANIYFGVEQSFQIDSMRYAIDKIENIEDREWLLGVLIITASVIASNYGGHFAQPRKIEEKNIDTILEKRKRSAWLEFSKRMIAIAGESETREHEISMVEGPWDNAMDWFEKQSINNVLVYLDAPYKREDYSRYYHVLETLARYDYPCSEFKSRSRSSKLGERFRSEFSTRNAKKIDELFIAIITRILKNNFICAWSYSNNGNGDITKIISQVIEKSKCDVIIYAIEHKYKKQGKAKNRTLNNDVIEYCVIFKNSKLV